MFAYLTGKVTAKSLKSVVIEVNSVGYTVFCNERFLGEVKEGEELRVYTHLHVQEDAMELFGFLAKQELFFFELLIGISGIGPRSALNVLSAATIEELEEAIVTENDKILTKVSGIGEKMARKIILELKSKIKESPSLRPHVSDDLDALEALVGMGYGQKEAREALRQVPGNIKGIEKRVKEALKLLGK